MTVPSSPLAALLDGLADPAFAVLDGAVFDDLPDRLAAYGLEARPLLRDEPGGAVQREGPWLLAIEQDPKRRAALLTIMAEAPGRAGVIWATDAGEAVLYAHLRSLNQVSLPSGERVFFRYADPNVMNAVLPLLDAGQAARMLGPASALAFDSGEAGGAGRVARPDGLPIAPDGDLIFIWDQIEILNERQRDLNIAEYLRETCPDEVEVLTTSELRQVAHAARDSAAEVGLRGPEDERRWAYLWLKTGGELDQEGVHAFLADSAYGTTVRERLDRLWTETLANLVAQASAGR